jgi:hypothetical protein
MVAPRAHTHPAKLVAAFLTRSHRASADRGERLVRAPRGTLHVIWLQPPFFSMVAWHLGHSLVFALIQLAVSLSSAHFFNHRLASAHVVGIWSLSAQLRRPARPLGSACEHTDRKKQRHAWTALPVPAARTQSKTRCRTRTAPSGQCG